MSRQLPTHIRDQPRERLAQVGASSLQDSDLLQILLGVGTKQYPVHKVARQVAQYLNQRTLPQIAQLQELAGVGYVHACKVVAAFELGRRWHTRRELIHTTADVLPLVHEYRHQQREHLICITLSGANELQGLHVVSVGTLTAALIHPREVFGLALRAQAASIILVHNHPSGIATPSSEDCAVTQIMQQAGDVLGMPLRDHLIITPRGDYYSFAENGW